MSSAEVCNLVDNVENLSKEELVKLVMSLREDNIKLRQIINFLKKMP